MELIQYLYTTIFLSDLSYLFYGFLVIAFGGYAVLAGGSYWYFYVAKKSAWASAKIQAHPPTRANIVHEITWSLSSTCIWVLFAMGVIVGIDQGIFHLYFSVAEYGVPYFFLSIILLVFFHDTYFYWTHRFMHSSFTIYKIFHKVHHDSKNPTPFAIHSFAPLEAVALALYIPLILLVMPVHLYALMTWFTIETTVNTMGHLGFELFPLGIFHTKFGKWLNPPTHHNLHHQSSRTGFSHYFNFWDRIMGTNPQHYDELMRSK